MLCHRSCWLICINYIIYIYIHIKLNICIYFVIQSGCGYSSHTMKDPLLSSLIPCSEFDFPNVTICWQLLSNTMSSIAKCCRLITRRSHDVTWKPNKYPPFVPTHSTSPATLMATILVWSWGIPFGINCIDLIW